MKYLIKKKVLEFVSDDASWPIPHYKYVGKGSLDILEPIHIGEKIDGMKILEINYNTFGLPEIIVDR